MDKTELPVLGIDLGGTKISCALVSNCRVLGEVVKMPTPSGPDNIIRQLVGLVETFSAQHLVLGIGIATAGSVDPQSGKVIGATGNLPGWEGTPLKQILQSKTALRTHVENDANAAAFGEYSASEDRRGKKCIVTVTLGTGIGVGTVIDGQLFRGAHFCSQGGHIKVAMSHRRRCTCGLWDCWEAYGAGYGLISTALEMLAGVASDQSILASNKATLTTHDITDAAAAGDLLGQRVLEQWHEHVAVGLVSLAHTFDPDLFLLAGGMSKFIDYELLKELVMDQTLPRVREALDLSAAQLGDAAGMIGAAELVRRQSCQENKSGGNHTSII